MLGHLVDLQAESPAPEIGMGLYAAGLLLACIGNLLTLRGLGPGPWQPFLRSALVLDGLACIFPICFLVNSLPDAQAVMVYLPWNWLPSIALHVGALAALIWGLGEVCWHYRLPLSRLQMIRVGFVCLVAAIAFFLSADLGHVRDELVICTVLVQLALAFPILKIRASLSVVDLSFHAQR